MKGSMLLSVTVSLVLSITHAHGKQFPRRQVDPCDAPCSNLFVYATICTDDACICPYALASASACSSCLLNVDANPTAAADIGSGLAICQTETGATAVVTTPPPTPAPTGGGDPCDAPCSNLFVYASICTDDACICPYALASASACSSCLLNVDANPTAAADIASGLAICQTENSGATTPAATPGPGVTTGGVTNTPTTNPGAGTTATGATTSPATKVAKSGSERLTMSMVCSGYLQMVMFLAAVLGFLCAFG